MLVVELIIVLLAIFLGARLGGIGIGFAGGLGVLVLAAIGVKPGNIPFDVISIIMAVIAAISAMQVAGGLDYLVHQTEKLLLAEQDALNVVINGEFVELEERFNHLIEVNNPLMAGYNDTDVILHCVNETKAWTQGCLKPICELYWCYVRQSLWHDLQPSEPTTVKAAFLAATTAELQGEHEQARRYYVAVINRFTDYYQNKAPQLLQAVRRECLAAAAAEKQGEAALAVRCYGLAARRLMEQYLRDNPGLVDS